MQPIVRFDDTYNALRHAPGGNGAVAAVQAQASGGKSTKHAVSGKMVQPAAGPPIIIFGTTSSYVLTYNDQGSGADMDGSFYRPEAPDGFYILGDYAQGNYNPPAMPVVTIQVQNDDPSNPVLRPPASYVQIWNDQGSGADRDGSIWAPVPPAGYVALGAVSQAGYNMPNVPQLRCMRFDLVKQWQLGPLIWNDQGSGAHLDVSVYQIPGLNTFYAQGNYNPPTGPVWFPIALGG